MEKTDQEKNNRFLRSETSRKEGRKVTMITVLRLSVCIGWWTVPRPK